MDAVVVENLNKRFKKYPTRTDLSLKTAVLGFFKNKKKSPPKFSALVDISFKVPKGNVLGIIGPNGAGKSTLLRILSGVYRPDSGKISIQGKMSALLSLTTGFNPALSGRENIIIAGLAMGLRKKTVLNLIDEIVEFAELQDFIDAPTRTYSSGMISRLAFSTTINIDPDILLLDEIFAVGDARFGKKCRTVIDKKFKENGKTILLVTHNLGLVKNWCNQAVFLSGGQILADGHPKDVIPHYEAMIEEKSSDPEPANDVELTPSDPGPANDAELSPSDPEPANDAEIPRNDQELENEEEKSN